MKPFPYTLDPEQIPAPKIVAITMGGVVRYACPKSCALDHHKAWVRALRDGVKGPPEPMPWAHCMFTHPVDYACIPYGCTDPATIRAAYEHDILRMLGGGWSIDVTSEQMDTIVRETADARMRGEDPGTMPFMACLLCAINN